MTSRRRYHPPIRWLIPMVVALLCCTRLSGQSASFEQPPIDYLNAAVDNAVARLVAKTESGEIHLEYEKEHGYLKSVLDELDIPVSSQILVFSKTSRQATRISPDSPRAIYFSDEVYVGWCQHGDVLEIGATDSRQGPIFYTLRQIQVPEPVIVRDQGHCIVCHASSRTQNVPGYFVRSVFPNRAGHPNYGSGTYTTDQTSPFHQRWGGWYVTGSHGGMRHMGNTIFPENERTDDLEQGANKTTLEGLVSTRPYLSSHSDLVALMVLEHQSQMQNAITFANFETRQALHYSRTMNAILDREPDFVDESAQRRIQAASERVVSHLLMCHEFPLADPVSGSSGFAGEFVKQGKRDSRNRSLRELDLKSRLFRYPCSYLIYSPSFDELPDEVRKPIIARLHQVLEGHDQSPEYEHLDANTRQAILEILLDTKPEFAGVTH